MSFPTQLRYVPHSETTRAYYEQLLLDLRRCLPPGVDDDLEAIAEQVLAIVCAGGVHNAGMTVEMVHQQQVALERLLDTSLKRETRDHLLRYGRLITDYVAASPDAAELERGGAEGEEAQHGPRGVFDLNEDGPSSSSASSASSSAASDNDDANLITGLPAQKSRGRKKGGDKARKKALRADKTLSRFAFSGGGGLDGEGPDDGDGANVFETDPSSAGAAQWGAVDGAAGGDAGDEFGVEAEAPKISFDEVTCNAQYVRDTLRRLFPSQTLETCEAQAARVVDFLSQKNIDEFTLETQLTAFLGGYDNEEAMDWIGDLRGSRWGVVYGLRYAVCSTQKEKTAVMDAMRDHALEDSSVERLYHSLTGKEVDLVRGRGRHAGTEEEEEEDGEDGAGGAKGASTTQRQPPLRKVDLQACSFQDERAPHRYVRATVPQGTQRASYDTHDEVTLPPSASYNGSDPLVPLSRFPAWCHGAFRGVTQMNPMQSRVFDCAFRSDENMLVSAPTGAGKTNVAMMAMLRAVDNATDRKTGSINLRDLKMVYVAPMKALVQEVVRTFSERLEPLGLTVVELSGDSALTQQQMAETQLIVTTPEKWDIVTRKSVELGVAALLKLLIIDEVHLLHNERGPVLEAIVARTMLQQQLRGAGGIRLVGLSATLPNYEDVAAFLQVDRQRGLFVFDSSYRPIPLEQTFCAVKKVKGLNQAAVTNRVAYEKVLQAAQENEQTMIFVHSRKETEYTAFYMQKRAMEEHQTHYFVRPGSEHERALQEAVNSPDTQLRRSLLQLLPGGFAIHHAGLSRDERHTVEELFAERRIKVLVCTSTLAWGVNLPANRVIIKGTRVFNGSKGESELLSALDVLQMFGRAGRVGFGAAVGRAAIITSPEDLHYYLCVLNQQLPIESQMMKRVVDTLNAEIALGHVESTREGVKWLQRTYLYVRMLKAPEVYGVRRSASDPLLLHHLENIVHTACDELKSARMADYDVASRKTGPTPYGRIASHCYVTAASVSVYLANLSNCMQDTDLFRVFALSSEFANLAVRVEEQAQLKELLENAPIAVRESRYTPLAKINILLQCYISRKNLEGLPLMSEIVYVKDSAQRILRALYEICLVREFGRTARQFLQLYTMVVRQQWAVESPVRQVRDMLAAKNFDAILPALERVRVPWEELRAWTVEDLAERLSDDRRADMALQCIHAVPHFVVEAAVRPLARNMLYVDVDITPDFTYSESLHGRQAGEVLLIVETPECRILHCETVRLPVAILEAAGRESYACSPAVVPMVEPKPTHLYVRCVSPNWVGCESMAAVCLLNMPLPAVVAPLRELGAPNAASTATTDMEDREVASVLARYKLAAVGEQIFPFESFLSSQRELIEPIFDSPEDSLFAGIAPGGGKTAVAELFTLQFLLECAVHEAAQKESEPDGSAAAQSPVRPKLLYVTGNEDTAERRFMDWRFKFGETLKLSVVRLERAHSPSSPAQLATLSDASIIVASGAALLPWVRAGSPALRGVTHIVADHLHLLRSAEGRSLEECLARLQSSPYLVQHGERRARLLALSYPLISCAELCRWLRIRTARQYNFGVSYRQLRVRVEGLELPSARSRYETSVVFAMKLLQRSPYAAMPCVVFVPYAREAETVAKRLLLRCRDVLPSRTHAADAADGQEVEAHDDDNDEGHVTATAAGLASVQTDDARLGVLLSAGVGYLHRGTTALDMLTILDQLEHPAVHPRTRADLPLILVCAFDAAWRLPASLFSTAMVCCAERLSATPEELARASTAVPATLDCGASELLQMVSRASNEAVVFCRTPRRWVWSRLLNDPLPLESHLRYPEDFCDTVGAAVADGRAGDTVGVLRVLQSHYFLHHVRSNLSFYGLTALEDIPLFASDFASRTVQLLREQGCVTMAHRTVAPADEEQGGAEKPENEEEEEEENPHAPIRATALGVAVAHHCISMDSVRTVREAVSSATSVLDPAALWLLLARHCEELSPAYLGDAARITEAAEYRALHSIARALPTETVGIRYVDLDFSVSSTKVFLLVVAHCARVFPNVLASPAEEEAAAQEQWEAAVGVLPTAADSSDAGLHHPFEAANVSPTDLALLCDLPETLAARLCEDLAQLLPAVQHVVRAMVELVDGDGRGEPVGVTVSARSLPAQQLMALSQCICRRTWPSEDALLQLPTVQLLCRRSVPGAPTLPIDGLTLSAVQQKLPTAVLAGLLPHGRQTTVAASALADTAARLECEARTIPVVLSASATGEVEEDGTLALAVSLSAAVAWTSPRSQGLGDSDGDASLDDGERAWWMACAARRKSAAAVSPAAKGGPTRTLARRVLTLTQSSPDESHDAPAAAAWTLRGQLRFPLSALDAEGDLDDVDLVVTVTSQAYRVSTEAVVGFAVAQ